MTSSGGQGPEGGRDDAPSRRRFLKWILAGGGLAAAGAFLGSRFLFPGGTPRSEDADGTYLRDTDVVFGLEYAGVAKAYPQRVLVWHEIMNDTVAGESLHVTYCPLTGSQIAFKEAAPPRETVLSDTRLDAFHESRASGGPPKDGIPAIDRATRTFGVSGLLVNSNLTMYDRATDSEWPQILGTAVNGPRRGEVLEEVPLVWTTWARWRATHPDTAVVGTDTGYIRDYTRDPYGSYDPDPGGYYASGSVWFPVLHRSDRFPAKKVVFGLRVEGQRMAIPFRELRSVGAAHFELGGLPLAALYDGSLDTLRVFRRDVEGEVLTFDPAPDGFVDRETASAWSPAGEGREGPHQGASLTPVNAFNVMWFAWYGFYPDTQVLAV